MQKVILLSLAMGLVLFVATSDGLVVHEDDYENRTLGAATEGWHWANNGATAHTGQYAEYDGSIVREHTGTIDSADGANANGRFGYKVGMTMSGNTSSDPADYTVEFDIRNLSGDWTSIPFEIAIVSMPENYGHTFNNRVVTQADGWVHIEFNLADWDTDWWNGANWDLLKPDWDIEIGFPAQTIGAGESWTQIFLVDNLKITMGADTDPHDPNVIPLNEDGTVGTLLGGLYARFTLAWMAGGDPGPMTEYPVNPDIRGHYVYLSQGSAGDDPNVYLLDYVPQVHNADPNLTSGYNTYGPITRKHSTTYYWQVEEALDDGTGNPLPAGDPNNLLGPLWSFTTISTTPSVMEDPRNDVADASGNASFSARGSSSATHYRWYKVGSPDVEVAEGLVDSQKRTTLNFTGATLADEGQYYCIFYFGNPDTTGIPSQPSATARLWTSRLIGYWKFDGDTTDSVGAEVAGAPAHDATMKTGDPNFVTETGDSPIIGTNALRIYSDGQFLLLPDADYFNFYQDGFTVSLWYKEYAPQPPGNVFLSKFDVGTSGWLMRSYDGADSAGDFIVENADTALAYDAIPDNQWNLLTVTYDPAAAILRTYTNGELSNQTTVNLAALPIPAGPVEIGGEDSFGTDVTGDIAIDELRMYSYPKTTVEIAQNYLAITGGDWICNMEIYDLQAYDTNGNCLLDLPDLASLAARWLEDDRIYPD